MTKVTRNKYTTGVLMEAVKQAGSQKEMGAYLNVSGDKVCKYVNGACSWTPATIAKLAKHTNTDPVPMLLEMLLDKLDAANPEQSDVMGMLEEALSEYILKAENLRVTKERDIDDAITHAYFEPGSGALKTAELLNVPLERVVGVWDNMRKQAYDLAC